MSDVRLTVNDVADMLDRSLSKHALYPEHVDGACHVLRWLRAGCPDESVSREREDDGPGRFGDAEALRLAIALIQATPEDDAEHAHVEVDPVRYAIALIRAAGQK